jgi:hypothetical protein
MTTVYPSGSAIQSSRCCGFGLTCTSRMTPSTRERVRRRRRSRPPRTTARRHCRGAVLDPPSGRDDGRRPTRGAEGSIRLSPTSCDEVSDLPAARTPHGNGGPQRRRDRSCTREGADRTCSRLRHHGTRQAAALAWIHRYHASRRTATARCPRSRGPGALLPPEARRAVRLVGAQVDCLLARRVQALRIGDHIDGRHSPELASRLFVYFNARAMHGDEPRWPRRGRVGDARERALVREHRGL